MEFADVRMEKCKVVQHARQKIWYNTRLNMSGEMHMRRRRDAKTRYSAAYPTGAGR